MGTGGFNPRRYRAAEKHARRPGHAPGRKMRIARTAARRRPEARLTLALVALIAAVLAHGSPLADYGRVCREPAARVCEALKAVDRRARCGADQVLSAACTEFLGGLAAKVRPTREERLVLIRGRMWIHRLRDDLTEELEYALCDERRALAKDHPGYAEALYDLARCADENDERVALLRTALDVDPENVRALYFLTLLTSEGDHYGIDAQQLMQYQTTGYEISRDNWERITYAGRIYDTALRSGDAAIAKAIQDRLRHDVLDYREHPEHVDYACSVFHLGLGEVCIAAFESRLQAGIPVPDEMLRHIPRVLSSLRHVLGTSELGVVPLPITDAERDAYVDRLKRVLDAQAPPYRSSEYYRVYAEFVDGPERLAALQNAVGADHGNADAKCSLGGELMSVRAYQEAWDIYAEMVAVDERHGSCDPYAELVRAGKPLGLAPP